MEINQATFTFNQMPELRQAGKKLEFKPITVDGEQVQQVKLKGGTIARLTQRDGKFDVTLIAKNGKDLSDRTVRVAGGTLSRVRNDDGTVKNLADNTKLISGKTLKLNAEFVGSLIKELEAPRPMLDIDSPQKKKKEKEEDDVAPEPLQIRQPLDDGVPKDGGSTARTPPKPKPVIQTSPPPTGRDRSKSV